MGYYGVIFPEFWTGQTGRDLRKRGGRDAQLFALYLMSNRHTNMLGLYRLDVTDMRHESGLPLKAIDRALQVVSKVGYACYDATSAYVWVYSMARFRVGLRRDETLTPGDNKVVAINRLYHAIDPNPFLGEFFDANAHILQIRKRRDSVGWCTPTPLTTRYSPLQGASKPLVSQVQRSGTGDQVQVQEKAPRLASRPVENSDSDPEQNRRVIGALVLDVICRAPSDSTFTDLKDLAKEACSKAGIRPYNSELVGSALEQAMARHTRRASRMARA